MLSQEMWKTSRGNYFLHWDLRTKCQTSGIWSQSLLNTDRAALSRCANEHWTVTWRQQFSKFSANVVLEWAFCNGDKESRRGLGKKLYFSRLCLGHLISLLRTNIFIHTVGAEKRYQSELENRRKLLRLWCWRIQRKTATRETDFWHQNLVGHCVLQKIFESYMFSCY